ncbi:MAG TPA: hypothetical protein VHE33_17480 [Acidobacteriaceae bacterium]|jgi:hypothetical protein|nr:hypothetical protein [Acidobacteriaceae bacterium]
METTAQASAVELLNAGIHALTHADAARLEELGDAASGCPRTEIADQQRLAQERLQILGALITLTRRNLRLFLSVSRCRVLAD